MSTNAIRNSLLGDPDWIAGRILKGRSDRQIAEELGVHPASIGRARRAHDLSSQRDRALRLLTREALSGLLGEGLSLTAIGEHLGFDRRTVRRYVLRHGLRRAPEVPRNTVRRLRRWYVADGCSAAEVGRRLGVDAVVVRDLLDRAGIAVRRPGRAGHS